MNIKHKNQSGFTLIEVGIVVLILGLIVGSIFKLFAIQDRKETRIEEEAVNKKVVAALSLHLKQNGFYPCPANPTLGPGNADFGRADCSVTSVGGVAASDVLIGAVPFSDLNLPFKASVNTDNYKYVYAVTQNLTTASAAPGGMYTGQGSIRVEDAGGTSLTNLPVHFVVVNPGGDGKGARTLQGVQALNCGSAADSENCDFADAVFVDAQFAVTNDINDNNYYDDTITYTLAREESTFWLMQENAGGTGGLNIVNRNVGNIGIGEDAPAAKMHVRGDVRVQPNSTGDGGNMHIDNNVTADGNITARGEVRTQRAQSPVFYYDN